MCSLDGTQDDSRFYNIVTSAFYEHLPKDVKEKWMKKYGRAHYQSVYDALVNGFSTNVLEFYEFLSVEHLKHCPLDEVASGVASLPLYNVYMDGKKDRETTRVLPITGQTLDGKELYRRTVARFTTNDMTPEEIYEEGLTHASHMHEQVIFIFFI